MATNNIKVGLQYFIGEWELKREIESFGDGEGKAIFRQEIANISELYYEEEVMFVTPTSQIEGTRKYKYVEIDKNSEIEVYFNDGPDLGKVFLRLSFSNSKAKCQHLCGEDIYDATYTIKSRCGSITQTNPPPNLPVRFTLLQHQNQDIQIQTIAGITLYGSQVSLVSAIEKLLFQPDRALRRAAIKAMYSAEPSWLHANLIQEVEHIAENHSPENSLQKLAEDILDFHGL